jgi:hypothetical protein
MKSPPQHPQRIRRDPGRSDAARQFKPDERSLQARTDPFNIINHRNFGPPANYMTSPRFGQAPQMLGSSLGSGGDSGGLNPLYEIGGPRSAQLALKLIF